MKKILSIILCLSLMLILLCACGAKTPEKESVKKDPTETTTGIKKEETSGFKAETLTPEQMKVKREEVYIQNDNETVDKLTDAVLQALTTHDNAEQCRTAIAEHIYDGNVSCYVDLGKESLLEDPKTIMTCHDNCEHYKIITDNDDQLYLYTAGNMKGVTITFKMDKIAEDAVGYVIADAAINEYITGTHRQLAESDNKRPSGLTEGIKLSALDNILLDTIKSLVGENIKISSELYVCSDYTVFIAFNDEGVYEVWGAFNGTHLEPFPLVD